MRRRDCRVGVGILGLLTVMGCGEATSPGASTPAVVRVVEAPASANHLAAVLSYTVEGADSVRFVYRADTVAEAATPYDRPIEGRGQLVVLGLAPHTAYRGRLETRAAGGRVAAESVAFVSGDLPAALRSVRLTLTAGTPPPGYLLTEVTVNDTAFAVAFDPSGNIRWYRGFPAASGEHALEAEQQVNGHFTMYVGASRGWEPVPGRYFEFTAGGESLAVYTAGGSLYTDPHVLLLHPTPSGQDAYLFGYDLRLVDLTALGGTPGQLIAGHSLLRQSASGAVEFQWSAWDHFAVSEWVDVPPDLAQQVVIDFDHPNAIELDDSGNYLVSFASLTQIVNIDHATGAMRWRFGGRANQFAFQNDPLAGFGIQHDVHLFPNGDLLFFDNGNFHNPPESRAVEYRLDTLAMTATLVWQYRHTPIIAAPFVGSTQRYRNGNTLIGYGAAGIMTEVTPDGTVVWEAQLSSPGPTPTTFYRVRELPSLYVHEAP